MSLRSKHEEVLWFAWEEGRGFAGEPVVVAGSVEGGEGVTALAAGQVEVAGFLVARRNGKTHRGPVGRSRYPRHAAVARLRIGGHV